MGAQPAAGCGGNIVRQPFPGQDGRYTVLKRYSRDYNHVIKYLDA
jgi:hypothetical protein